MYCIGCILDFHREQYDYLIYIEGKCVCNMDLEKNKVAAKSLSKNERTSKLKIHLFATW